MIIYYIVYEMESGIIIFNGEFFLVSERLQVSFGNMFFVIGMRRTIWYFGAIFLLQALFYEEVDFVEQHDHADNKTENYCSHFEVNRGIDLSQTCAWSATHHAAIVHRHE